MLEEYLTLKESMALKGTHLPFRVFAGIFSSLYPTRKLFL